MSHPQGRTPPLIIEATERILSEAFGGRVRLSQREDLGGSRRTKVCRCAVIEAPVKSPASVIVKAANPEEREPYDPDNPESGAWTLFNEWAGLEFLQATSVPLVPRLYGGDRAMGVLVIEDLGTVERLDQRLLAEDAESAWSALFAYARALGQMHALTIGHRSAYDRARDLLGPRRASGGYRDDGWLRAVFREVADAVGMLPRRRREAERDVMRVEAAMRDPGPFLAYTHGDACPNNFLLTDDGPRLIDFEGGLYGHALRDGAYARLHFATCWCVYRMPERLWRGMEETYRADLARGCPEASDHMLFGRALVEACAYRTLEFLQDFILSELLERDREIVTSTARQRVLLRFEAVAHATEEFGHLETLGAALRVAAERLRALWPPEAAVMPYYPAFRGETMAAGVSHQYPMPSAQETRAIEGPASRFFRKGRLSAMPAKRKNRLIVLRALAGCFEPHRTYAEDEVNEVLLPFHDDYCSLRRALVDEGFLSRSPSGAEYRRIEPTP